MPEIRDIALEELAAAGDPLPIVGTRVDPAHPIGNALAELPPLAEMSVDLAIADMLRVEGVAQLQAQADQLAAQLQKRHQELNRREAELHARQADFEQEVREAQLWLAERNDQLNDREERLTTREAAVGRLAPGLTKWKGASKRPTFDDRETDRQQRQQVLGQAREQLDRRRAALDEFWREFTRTHERALELRLLADELLAQLRASLGDSQAGHALAAVRQRLAHRYRTEVEQLTKRPHELEWLRKDLAAEHERLEKRYEELNARTEEQNQVLGLRS